MRTPRSLVPLYAFGWGALTVALCAASYQAGERRERALWAEALATSPLVKEPAAWAAGNAPLEPRTVTPLNVSDPTALVMAPSDAPGAPFTAPEPAGVPAKRLYERH